MRWIAAIVRRLPKGVPVIVFAKGMAAQASELAATGASVLGMGPECELRAVADAVPANVAVQGNLDPELLEREPEEVTRAATALLASMRGRPGHIVNLGHGIRPTARLDAVQALVDCVRGWRGE